MDLIEIDWLNGLKQMLSGNVLERMGLDRIAVVKEGAEPEGSEPRQ